MATLNRALTLRHQANLGEDVVEVAFEAGAEITLLQEWEQHCLVKDSEGRLFNVPKDAVSS